MIGGEEMARALGGLGRLARFDPAAGLGFGHDRAACARSFGAYALASPAVALLIAIKVLDQATADPLIMTAAATLSMLIQIVGFPLLLRPVLAAYGRAERWDWFVTGYNWFNAAQITLLVAVLGLGAGSLAPLGLWPTRLVQVYFLVLEAFLAHALLGVGGFRSAGIVLLDVFFGAVTDGIANWIGTGSFSL